jgi:hypothetical protein
MLTVLLRNWPVIFTDEGLNTNGCNTDAYNNIKSSDAPSSGYYGNFFGSSINNNRFCVNDRSYWMMGVRITKTSTVYDHGTAQTSYPMSGAALGGVSDLPKYGLTFQAVGQK